MKYTSQSKQLNIDELKGNQQETEFPFTTV